MEGKKRFTSMHKNSFTLLDVYELLLYGEEFFSRTDRTLTELTERRFAAFNIKEVIHIIRHPIHV